MVYFISDAHLGSRALTSMRTRERRLVNFLDKIKEKATAVYMLGDMFDFWFEYRNVVPKGYTRFLGKVSELTDRGVEVHFFIGNHDIWCKDYLTEECGVVMHYVILCHRLKPDLIIRLRTIKYNFHEITFTFLFY